MHVRGSEVPSVDPTWGLEHKKWEQIVKNGLYLARK